jgi:hypothetical protein
MTATLAGVLAAIIFTDRFISKQRLSASDASLCVLALAIASFGYAVGRLVVIFLCIFILYRILQSNFKVPKSRWVGLLFVGGVTIFGLIQYLNCGAQRFIHARGEQLANVLTDPAYQRDFLGITQDSAESKSMTQITFAVVRKTVPEFLRMISPINPSVVKNFGVASIGDPPLLPLYLGALLPCILIGLKESFSSRFIGRGIILLGVGYSVLLPLLGTTRVDFHRAFLAVIPLTIWCGVGILQVAKAVNLRWPKLTAPLIILLALGMWAESARLLWPNISEPAGIAEIISEVELAPAPFRIGYSGAHTEWTALSIAIAKRSQTVGAKNVSFLSRPVVADLSLKSLSTDTEAQRFKEKIYPYKKWAVPDLPELSPWLRKIAAMLKRLEGPG